MCSTVYDVFTSCYGNDQLTMCVLRKLKFPNHYVIETLFPKSQEIFKTLKKYVF